MTTNFPFPTEGDLESTPPIEIICHLFTNKLDGCLITHAEKRKKALYFKSGKPIGAKSNQPEETLIRLAKKFKIVDDETFESLVEAMDRKTGKTQGQLLQGNGVSQTKVDTLLARQTALRFADVCNWDKGRYRIKAELPSDIPGLATDPLTVLVEYAKKQFKPDVFRGVVAKLADQYPIVNQQKLEAYQPLLPDDSNAFVILKSIDGKKIAKDIFTPPDQDPKATKIWLALYALEKLQIIHFAEQPQATKQGSTEEIQADITSQPEKAEVKPKPAVTAKPKPAQAEQSISPATEDSQPELTEIYKDYKEKNYFEILGLDTDATAKDVKKAYFQLAKKYHPDKFFNQETKTPSSAAEQLFALINRAYEELRDVERRQMYADYITKGSTEEEEIQKAEDILSSEVEYQKGMILIRRKNYRDAAKHLKRALELYEEEPDYAVQYNWSRFMSAYPDKTNEYENAMVDMKHLVNRGGRASTTDSWYLYGRMQKITGNSGGALKAFKKVLEMDKKHKDAAREIRAIEGH